MENIKTVVLTGVFVVASSWVTGNHLIESNKLQVEANLEKYQSEQKSKYIDKIASIYAKYDVNVDSFVRHILADNIDSEKVISSFTKSQELGQELILLTNDEVSPLVNNLNYHLANVLKNLQNSKGTVDLKDVTEAKVVLKQAFRSLIHRNLGFEIQ
ncbi:hypothetical protein P3551_23585 [Vibrio parahaemolyticus]|uniref:hypothetical protein n=1 Tax=Vibrio sp. JPW-9-11-11 TaxID=1416532 RepID=UPI0015945458|nr:hypothetical protein [Vibrio sp. JPW-9-11-11]MDF4902247.1 hypothetical protein [Vibrio parahaemolyticus]NVD08281.1 hypothetical protein [Vibrio sp. JPW-9-11-11]HCH5257143.1 hypothetical protein [Vibrio parahaemolyticus]